MKAILLLILLLPSCALLSEHDRMAARALLQREYEAGNLTAAQRDAGIEAIESGSGFDWEGLGFFGINALLALVGGPFLVRRMRGPPTQKVGLPATKVLQ